MSHVVLADSCPLTRTILSRFLQEAKIEASSATNARDVVALLAQTTGNTVLVIDLDAVLSGGFPLVQYLRKLPIAKRLKVVGITFTQTRDHLAGLLKSGIDTLVLKEELSRTTLVQRVTSMMGATSSPKAIASKAAPTETVITAAPAPAAPAGLAPPQEIPNPLTTADVEEAIIAVAAGRTIKPVVQEVVRLTHDERSDLSDLVNVIRVDPSLTAKIVGAANSAFYKRAGGEVKSLQDAVSMIGMDGVHQLTMSLGIADDINDPKLEGPLALPRLWGHSLATGHLAEWIAGATELCEPGQAFIVGMLHDYGRRLMTWQVPDHYRHVLTSRDHLELPLLERERQIVGMDHAVLAARVMDRWGCPPFMSRAITMHHSEHAWNPSGSDKFGELIRVLCLADALAIAFGFEADETDELPAVPLQWLADTFMSPEDEGKKMNASLMERIGLLMSRTSYEIKLPKVWKGDVRQILVIGARPMQLDPLQATLLRGYPNAKVVAPAKADLSERFTTVLADWRGLDRSDCMSSASWLSRQEDVSNWPMLIVHPVDGLRLESMAIPCQRVTTLKGLLTPDRVQHAMENLVAP